MRLQNKNINLKNRIPFLTVQDYLNPKTYKDINILKEKVKNILYNNKNIITNKATGFNAKITNITINKIIHPKPNFKVFNTRYINNLNAACYLNTLFKNAIYIDTLKPMKNKTNNKHEIGYHHFVAPLKMNGQCYKAMITVKEKINSKILYVISVQLFPFNYFKKDIKVKELMENINIWNYELNEFNHYSCNNFIADSIDEYVWIIA